MKYLFMICCMLLTLQHGAYAKIISKNISYSANGTTLDGYIAYDDAFADKRPGILVVHEWWGQNDYARKRADMLAALGYTALALDMYGDGKTADHPMDAGQMASMVKSDMRLERDRFNAALGVLKQQPTVNSDAIAAIGYCFGGSVVLDMARIGTPIKGVVSFHGSPIDSTNPAKQDEVKADVLVFNGEADKFVPPEQIKAFKAEMATARAHYKYYGYSAVYHGFTNPAADDYAKKYNLPLAYDAFADQDSWQKMQDFLKHIFATSASGGGNIY